MNLKLLSSLVVMAVLVLSYQNCSNSMSFDGSEASLSKADNVNDALPEDQDPVAGDPSNPINAMPPDEGDDLDTDIDYDHEGRRVAFSCVTGAKFGWDEAALKKADDLNLKNKWRILFHYARPIRNVSVENIRGSVAIKNSYRTIRYDNVSGLVSYLRSLEIDKVSNIQSMISSTASIKLIELSNIKSAYVCASGQEIGKIDNLEGGFIKLRGRQPAAANSANAKATEISNIKAGFTSVYKLDVAKFQNVEGELIIRNSRITSLENIKGGLTLINSTVDLLKNVEGVVRTKNSTITTEENVTARRVNLP
ncbi:MAG: hypothetical protein J0L82_11360 [Deltaproteobacteria bacterium]|jgi:hypothetical protein|nr:hypothetical protein [Deltaproteobacteria bacterium]